MAVIVAVSQNIPSTSIWKGMSSDVGKSTPLSAQKGRSVNSMDGNHNSEERLKATKQACRRETFMGRIMDVRMSLASRCTTSMCTCWLSSKSGSAQHNVPRPRGIGISSGRCRSTSWNFWTCGSETHKQKVERWSDNCQWWCAVNIRDILKRILMIKSVLQRIHARPPYYNGMVQELDVT